MTSPHRNRRGTMRRALALVGCAALLTLAWPTVSQAEAPSLGGYSGVARADAIRVEIIDPTIPLPSDPQIDFGISHTKANTDTGPVSRAVASYLWPGDVIGDGFDQLVGNTNAKYPVQINSRFPATSTAPASNTAQITAGNGMTTSSNETTTRATASGLGISGQSTQGPLTGLCQLLNPKGCRTTPPLPGLPVEVSAQVSSLVTMSGGTSESSVTVSKNSVTSIAHATGTGLKLLGGLITIGNVDITSKTVSDGKKAVTTGTMNISTVGIKGMSLGIDGKSLDIAGKKIPLPDLPVSLTDLLKKIGISFDYGVTSRSVKGSTGSLSASGLIITVDTKLLRDALAPLTGLLADVLNKLPGLSKVTALLGLGPKMVFIIGDIASSATAQLAYVPPPTSPTGGTPSGGNTGGPTVNPGGGNTGGGYVPPGDGGGIVVPTDPGSTTPLPSQPLSPPPSVTEPIAFALPPLGSVPRMLILGALVLAGVFGWMFRSAGRFVLGSGICTFGLSTGVPDLRKGQP